LTNDDYFHESTCVSSIRLFVLAALEEWGEMHGHQLRLLAEEEHIDMWTDISVGGLYGAIRRLATEGLIESVRTEREGGYPERQIWRITEQGRSTLGAQLIGTLREIVFRPDPFDLAFTRGTGDKLASLPALLEARLARLVALEADERAHLESISQYLNLAEQYAMRHRRARMAADIEWLRETLAHLPEIIQDRTSREENP
jgi:DNA-binding PadR family transcriptional regulator